MPPALLRKTSAVAGRVNPVQGKHPGLACRDTCGSCQWPCPSLAWGGVCSSRSQKPQVLQQLEQEGQKGGGRRGPCRLAEAGGPGQGFWYPGPLGVGCAVWGLAHPSVSSSRCQCAWRPAGQPQGAHHHLLPASPASLWASCPLASARDEEGAWCLCHGGMDGRKSKRASLVGQPSPRRRETAWSHTEAWLCTRGHCPGPSGLATLERKNREVCGKDGSGFALRHDRQELGRGGPPCGAHSRRRGPLGGEESESASGRALCHQRGPAPQAGAGRGLWDAAQQGQVPAQEERGLCQPHPCPPRKRQREHCRGFQALQEVHWHCHSLKSSGQPDAQKGTGQSVFN